MVYSEGRDENGVWITALDTASNSQRRSVRLNHRDVPVRLETVLSPRGMICICVKIKRLSDVGLEKPSLEGVGSFLMRCQEQSKLRWSTSGWREEADLETQVVHGERSG